VTAVIEQARRTFGGRQRGEGTIPAAVLLASLLASSGCGGNAADSEGRDSSQVLVTGANIATVETRRLESGISFTGELVPSEVVEVIARFDGDLEAVLVREGQHVRQGQPLARYKPRELRDALQAAQASVQAAEADVTAAESAQRRAKRLLDAGAASPAALETAEAQLKAAQARWRSAQAQLAIAEENEAKLDVPSPIDGIVSRTYVHSGDRTAVGDRLMTLVDTRLMELEATVPSEALANVQPGTRIEFGVDGFPGEKFTGRVDRLNPTTDPGTRQVRVYTRVSNPDGRLVGGLFASGRIIRSELDSAVTAPVATLRMEGTQQVVYRLQNGVAERLPVQTGLVDEEHGIVELRGAVAPGDSLLTGVVPGLRPGAAVRILQSSDSTVTSGTGTRDEVAARETGQASGGK
jgi:membrane fusion protein, multidrug efflux system